MRFLTEKILNPERRHVLKRLTIFLSYVTHFIRSPIACLLSNKKHKMKPSANYPHCCVAYFSFCCVKLGATSGPQDAEPGHFAVSSSSFQNSEI